MNSGSTRNRSYAASSSRSGSISVSDTNVPPYGPKWPCASGQADQSIAPPVMASFARSAVRTLHLVDELLHPRTVLVAGRHLDPAADVHRVRAHHRDGGAHV